MVLLFVMMAAPSRAYCQTVVADTPASTSSAVPAPPITPAPAIAPVDTLHTTAAAAMTPADSVLATLEAPVDTARLTLTKPAITATDKKMLRARREHKIFEPDPQRALWLSFVIPGGGQIYNRKYWKLPIFYGGFLGCMYAFTWNQQMYLDYSQAYLDIMDDNPNTNSYLTMFPSSYNIDSNVSRYQTIFKNRKDRYRRWRDLSTFCFIGVYLLSVIDAYVDAHLSVFDISPDLSLQWGPTSVEGPHPNIGLGAALNF